MDWEVVSGFAKVDISEACANHMKTPAIYDGIHEYMKYLQYFTPRASLVSTHAQEPCLKKCEVKVWKSRTHTIILQESGLQQHS